MKIEIDVSRNMTQSGTIQLEVSEQEVREYFKDMWGSDGNYCKLILGPDDKLDIHEHVEPYVSDELYDKVHDAAEDAAFEEVYDEEWDVDGVWEIQ
jgi:hypothetical protein